MIGLKVNKLFGFFSFRYISCSAISANNLKSFFALCFDFSLDREKRYFEVSRCMIFFFDKESKFRAPCTVTLFALL